VWVGVLWFSVRGRWRDFNKGVDDRGVGKRTWIPLHLTCGHPTRENQKKEKTSRGGVRFSQNTMEGASQTKRRKGARLDVGQSFHPSPPQGRKGEQKEKKTERGLDQASKGLRGDSRATRRAKKHGGKF